MDVLFITILFLVIIICIFTVFFILIYNNFQDSIIRINEVEGKIDENLRRKYDLINRSITLIKGNIKIKSDIFDDVIRLRTMKINNFDLERKLINGYQELIKIKKENKELDKSQDLDKIIEEIKDIDNKLVILKDYYNNNITIYNKSIKIFPSNIIAMICKYQEKLFFDKKDMNDDDINDFKL